MPANIEQLYISNPASSLLDDDLLYLGRSPYGVSDDMAISGADLLANINTGVLSWTPVLKFGGLTTGITYSVQQGSYCKVGNVLTFTCRIILTSKGSATGNATVTGLPTVSAAYEVVNFSPTNITYVDSPSATLDPSSSDISLKQVVSAGVPTILVDTAFTNTSAMRVSGSYLV